MASSLMAALDEARALINEGTDDALGVDPVNPWVALLVAHHQTRPDQIAELYDVAGMEAPGAPDAGVSAYRPPHGNAVPQQVMAALQDRPHTARDLSHRLGAPVGTVNVAIHRLRSRGAHINATAVRGSRGCLYVLKG